MAGSGSPSPEQGIKLRRLTIRNYKAIDELTLGFPAPLMAGDPDIIVLGSSNGVGKTSVLEACALLLVDAGTMGFVDGRPTATDHTPVQPFSLWDRLIRAGEPELRVQGELHSTEGDAEISVVASRDGRARRARSLGGSIVLPGSSFAWASEAERTSALRSFAGASPNPLIDPPLLYFHSYRRVHEEDPGLDAMAGSGNGRWGKIVGHDTSVLKVEMLRALMRQGGLFEDVETAEPDEVLDMLNRLVARFAGGCIEKLRATGGGSIEFRVSPVDGGSSFRFDSLSSGQKEIISTLFLIWLHTREQPGIVLIDEPELHLNAEWHRAFVRSLHQLAPRNQYILATHSEDVFDSVDSERRILLVPGEDTNP
jgi:ABC-type transport system involved in cytochrome c biogenesis ATPase subunit